MQWTQLEREVEIQDSKGPDTSPASRARQKSVQSVRFRQAELKFVRTGSTNFTHALLWVCHGYERNCVVC